MSRSETRPGGRTGSPTRGRTRKARDRGYVTAETAMVIPMLVALTGLLLWGLTAAAAQVRCVDAARAGAREAARSETAADVLSAARLAAPSGAKVSVRKKDGVVRVRVTVPAPRFPVTLVAEADALDEETVGEGTAGGGGP